MTTLTARILITPIGEIAYPCISVDDSGLITDISTDPSIRGDSILTPTFLDIHIHGSVGTDVMDATPADLSRMARFLATHGTAHFLPTTVTASIDDTLHALERLANAIEANAPNDEATPIGIHLEGPFLSHIKRGVHPAALLQPPSIDLFDRLQTAARNHIRLLTLAPELPGALDLITYATQAGVRTTSELNDNPATTQKKPQRAAVLDGDSQGHQAVRVSLGHSNALAADTLAAIAAGAVSATHLFNAMRPLDHREPGIIGTVLDQPSLFADLICDGIHVHPALVRLWLAQKGDRAILITDAISATGMPDGLYTLGQLFVTVEAGRCSLAGHPETLAGSVLTLDQAVANLQSFTRTGSGPGPSLDSSSDTGFRFNSSLNTPKRSDVTSCNAISLATAIRCASTHPAALLGLPPNPFAPGQPANFNRYTPTGHLQTTYLHGQPLS